MVKRELRKSEFVERKARHKRNGGVRTIGVLAFQGDVVEHQTIIEKLGQHFLAVRSVEDLERVDALIIPGGESTTIGFFLKETSLDEAIKKRAGVQSLRAQTFSQQFSGVGKTVAGLAQEYAPKPLAVWGTCAGAIVLAKEVKAEIVPPHLGLIDMTIERNAYGRQIDSFYASIDIPKLKIFDLKAAFIRAPIITSIDSPKEIPFSDVSKTQFQIPPRGGITEKTGSRKPTKIQESLELATEVYKPVQQSTVLATHEGKIVLVQQGNLLASTFHPELTGDSRLHEYFLSLI